MIMVITWLLKGLLASLKMISEVPPSPKSRQHLPTEVGQADTGTGPTYRKGCDLQP